MDEQRIKSIQINPNTTPIRGMNSSPSLVYMAMENSRRCQMRNSWKITGILLMLSILLLTCSPLLHTATAQDNTMLADEMSKFKANLLPLIEGKSPDEATDIFFGQLESFYEAVGRPYKWGYVEFYEFMMDWENLGIVWPGNRFIIQSLPGKGELTEEEAIQIAEQTILYFSGISKEELDLCWPSTSYHKPYEFSSNSWYINYIVETPGENAPYYIKFALEIDPITGKIYNYFDAQSNDI